MYKPSKLDTNGFGYNLKPLLQAPFSSTKYQQNVMKFTVNSLWTSNWFVIKRNSEYQLKFCMYKPSN